MKENDEVRIKFGPSTTGIVMGIFLAFMGFVCFAGYVLMVSEPLRNTFIMYIGVIGFPLALAMIFDGFSCIYLRVLISHDRITIKRFLRRTITLIKAIKSSIIVVLFKTKVHCSNQLSSLEVVKNI